MKKKTNEFRWSDVHTGDEQDISKENFIEVFQNMTD